VYNNRNSYKMRCIGEDMRKVGKRGQMAPFIIFAIIIGAVILLFAFKDQVNATLDNIIGREFTPTGFLTRCIDGDLKEEVNRIGKQGSYNSLEGVWKNMFSGHEFAYLCYTNQNYVT